MTADTGDTLSERLERLESLWAIQQLPIRYALALDARDLDTWLSLFAEDVDCGRHGSGRHALRQIVEPQLRRFYRSVHQICGHEVDLVSANRAKGRVYCRAEHEANGRWIVMAICYFDEYVRHGPSWHFLQRRERYWYAKDAARRPAPPFNDWEVPSGKASLPHAFESWEPFWETTEAEKLSSLTAQPERTS